MTDEAMSPLRRRMIEDMTIRKFAPKTQHRITRAASENSLPSRARFAASQTWLCLIFGARECIRATGAALLSALSTYRGRAPTSRHA